MNAGKEFEVDLAPEGDYLVANVLVTTIPLGTAIAVLGGLTDLASRHSHLGWLVDVRGSRSGASVIEQYELAYHRATELGVPRTTRIAVLKDPDDDTRDFVESVMINAGFSLRLFDDRRQAIQWLTGRG